MKSAVLELRKPASFDAGFFRWKVTAALRGNVPFQVHLPKAGSYPYFIPGLVKANVEIAHLRIKSSWTPSRRE